MRLINCSFLLICSLLLGGCAIAEKQADPVFDKPPVVGSWLLTDRLDIRCESKVGARATAATGFVHPDCSVLKDTGRIEWRVIDREYEELDEGGLWLLRSQRVNGEQTWLVVPWHDWA